MKQIFIKERDYFKNIQGLRALAIFFVFAYHLDYTIFKGGYLGVDVFFVISGFVISLNINRLIENNSFSTLRFFHKRILRILPSIISVCLLCFIFIFFYFSPGQFKESLKVIFSSITFFSNYYFSNNIDYFDNISEFQPLLHTWSVSLEMQLYLVIGLVSYFFYKFKIQNQESYFLISILFLSILGSQFSGNLKMNFPFFEENFKFFNQSKYFSFYFIFGRLWEFLIGVLLFKNYKKIIQNSFFLKFQDFIFFSSLFLLLTSVYIFNEDTPTPSFVTLIPVIFTCFLILSSMSLKKFSFILENKIMNFIGKISFSIYLFHFPLIVFYKIYFDQNISIIASITIIIITILLSTINFYLVENKLRSIRSNTYIISTISIIIIFLGYFFYNNDIQKKIYFSKFSKDDYKEQQMIIDAINSDGYDNMFSNGQCIFWKKNKDKLEKSNFLKCLKKYEKLVLFIGDSHGMDNFNSFARNLTNENFIISFADGNCVPHKNFCDMNKITEFVETYSKNIQAIIYSERGSNLIKNKILLKKVDKNIEYLNKLAKFTDVIWLGFRNEPNIQLKYFVKLEKYFEKFENDEIKILDDYLISVKKNNRFEYISFLKNINYDYQNDFKVNNNFITYSDGTHLSKMGEEYFGKKLLLIDRFKLMFSH